MLGTDAHRGTRLRVKGLINSLPEGMILFPFTDGIEDTKGIVPIHTADNITVRKDEKRFVSSVAVEDASENIISSHSPNDAAEKGVIPPVPPPISTNQPVYRFAKTNWSGINLYINRPSIASGDEVTVSWYFYKKAPGAFAFNVQFDSSTVGNSNIGNFNGVASKAGWYRGSITYKFGGAHTSGIYFRIENQSTSLWDNADNECWVVGYQIEMKDHVTSFTEGVRNNSTLRYDISSLGIKDAGCVSCWIYNSSVMVNNLKSNGSVNNIYLIKMGSGVHSTDVWYGDAITVWMRSGASRAFEFWTTAGESTESIVASSPVGSVGTWNHFVIQWDKNGLPSGNNKEMYINGVLVVGTTTTKLPVNPITYLFLGGWSPEFLLACTMFEQLAIHPSQGFAPDVISNWYQSQSPFYDTLESFARW